MRVSPKFRRGIAAAALVLTLGPLAAGCGVDFSSGTTQIHPDNPSGQVGDIKVQNVVIVANDDQEQALLSMAIVSNGATADALTGVEVAGAREARVTGGRLEVPAGGLVIVGAGDGPSVTVTRNDDKPALGDFAQLTLNFEQAGQLQVQAPVVAATGPYASLTPRPTPTPTSSPAGGETPGRTPGGTPGGSPTETPPASPTAQ